MSARSHRLHRLLHVRRVFEEMERCRLQVARAAVEEVEASLVHQQRAAATAAVATAAALDCGDRNERLFAEAQSEVAAGNYTRLVPLLDTRRAEVQPATAAYLEHRMERKQVQQLIAEMTQQQQLKDDRKAQAASDDLSLARYPGSRR
jgi:hypothetical protein